LGIKKMFQQGITAQIVTKTVETKTQDNEKEQP